MSETKECISCGENIKKSAYICIHCQSYQNWRRYLSFSNTAITLVIALLSVASITIPAIKKTLTEDNSKLNVAYLSSETGKVNLLATNKGIRTGTIVSANMKLNENVYPLEIEGGAILIEKGNTRKISISTKDVAKRFYTEVDLNSEFKSTASMDSVCSMNIKIRSFSGNVKTFTFNKNCVEFLKK